MNPTAGHNASATLPGGTEGSQTLRWREMDSNFRFRRERTGVSSLGLLLARDRGVGADVSVQPGFVIIMPSPLEASGAPLCCSPVDPEDDERDQAPTIRALCRTE